MTPRTLALVLVGALTAQAAAPEEALAAARKAYSTLDYDRVPALLQPILDSPDTPLEVRVEAYVLAGSVAAVTRDVVDAEVPFRKLLRLRPEHDLSPRTAPKILAVFRKVQAEERALLADLKLARHQQVVSRLKLLDPLPTRARGGLPLKFQVRVLDPDGAVAQVQLPYRRVGEAAFSVLSLERDATGQWVGALPAELTQSEAGFQLEYYFASRDTEGALLLTQGSEKTPLAIDFSAGQVRRGRSLPRGVFVTGVVLTIAAALTCGAFALLGAQHQAAFDARAGTEVSVAERDALVKRGELLSTGTNVALASALGLAAATTATAFFVDWSPPDP